MYTVKNFKTKKAFKDAVAAGEEVRLYQPNNLFHAPDPIEGQFTVEGPHYPAPHTWYAVAEVMNGKVVSVK